VPGCARPCLRAFPQAQPQPAGRRDGLRQSEKARRRARDRRPIPPGAPSGGQAPPARCPPARWLPRWPRAHDQRQPAPAWPGAAQGDGDRVPQVHYTSMSHACNRVELNLPDMTSRRNGSQVHGAAINARAAIITDRPYDRLPGRAGRKVSERPARLSGRAGQLAGDRAAHVVMVDVQNMRLVGERSWLTAL
jgi:hypothetical protein